MASTAVSFTAEWIGLLALVGFALAHGVAMGEERLQVRKSVPVLVAAALVWILAGIAYALSPIADNLTTALLVGTVAMAVGRGHNRLAPLACINVVVASNAGGAFSPFGDITTLMVWQAGPGPVRSVVRVTGTVPGQLAGSRGVAVTSHR